MELPYYGPDGKPTGFLRWRYLEDTREGFAAQTDKDPLRYVQPPDTLPGVYLPPTLDWRAVMADPTCSVAVTEGELKSACCSAHLMPCIGLGGVYSFKSKKRSLPVLPVLKEFVWEGRDVVVLFDSDSHTNPMVAKARNELCRELLALGAVPRVGEVPSKPGGEKQGLDDLVVAEGVDVLRAVVDAAEPFSLSEALHELNAEVAYVKDPGLVVVLDTAQRMRASDFTAHAYANRHYHETVFDAKGNSRMVKKKAAQAWLEWDARLELPGIVYLPGEERIVPRGYNTWPGWGVEPKKGDVKPWKLLLDHLFAGHPAERQWFERWCAYPLQNPGAKMFTYAVLWGRATGTGKSLAGYSLGRIYGRNFTEIGDKELEDDRNAWAIDKQFVLGDDVTGQEQRLRADRLKKMMTQQMMRIDQKFVPSYNIVDVLNYLMTSNHPDAFFLEDDDRRAFVHEVKLQPLPEGFYVAYMEWLDGPGAAALFYHLLSLDLGGMRAADRAPLTASKEAMIEDGLSDLGRWVRELVRNPEQVLRIGSAKAPGDLWSAADLLRLYDPDSRKKATVSAMSRELKRAGLFQACNGMPVRTEKGQQRLFVARNQKDWIGPRTPKEAGEHYDKAKAVPSRTKKF